MKYPTILCGSWTLSPDLCLWWCPSVAISCAREWTCKATRIAASRRRDEPQTFWRCVKRVQEKRRTDRDARNRRKDACERRTVADGREPRAVETQRSGACVLETVVHAACCVACDDAWTHERNAGNETSLLGTGRGVSNDVFRIGCQRKTPHGLRVYVDVPTASRSSSRSYSTARAAPSPYSSSGVQRTQSAPPPTTAQGQAPGLLGSIAGMVGQGKMHDLQP